MSRFVVVVVALAALSACKDKSRAQGLPPAQEWSATTGDMSPAQQAPTARRNPHGGMNPHGGGDDPHAGVDMGGGGDPHAGVDMGGGGDPHAGVDMGGGRANPHGAGGPDVAAMGLPAPDPNRKIDPNNRVRGVIKIHPKAKDRIKAGGAVFLIVKRAAADGTASGPPLAVAKLTWQKDEVPFELTEANAMIAGTELKGDVVVTARYDQDGDALSKQPGDIVGTLRIKIPADNVKVTLDDILP